MPIQNRPILLLTALALALLSACSGLDTKDIWQDPKVNLTGVHMADMSFESVSLNADLDITNLNKYALAYGGIDYTLNVEKRDLFSGLFDQSGKIEAGQTQKITLPLRLKFEDIMNLVQEADINDGIDYTISGAVLFNAPVIGQVRIPLKRSGNMPMPEPPKVSVAGFNVKSISIGGAELDLQLAVENPNTFDLLLNGFNYSLNLNGNDVANGKSTAKTSWASGEGKTIAVPVKLSFAEGGLALFHILTKGGNLDYKLDFGTIVSSTSLPLKNLPFQTKKIGSVNLK